MNDIMQYLWELKNNILCPIAIRLQLFDFELNIDADKRANIFKFVRKIVMTKLK